MAIVVREVAESVLEVKRVSDRLMAMKLEVKGSILNIVSAYTPQVNNSMEEKNDFWKDLVGLIESVSKEKRIVLGADINGHVSEGSIRDEAIMGKYGGFAIVNTYFKKKDEHRVTYKSGVMCRRRNLKKCVIVSNSE